MPVVGFSTSPVVSTELKLGTLENIFIFFYGSSRTRKSNKHIWDSNLGACIDFCVGNIVYNAYIRDVGDVA